MAGTVGRSPSPPSLPTGALAESARGGADLTRQGPTCQGPGNREEAFVSKAQTHPGAPHPTSPHPTPPHPEAPVRAQRRAWAGGPVTLGYVRISGSHTPGFGSPQAVSRSMT